MNKRVASLFQGLLSVVLMLALVLPLPVSALEGAAGGEADGSQYGGGGGEGTGQGEPDSDGDGASDSAEGAASAAAAESVAAAASVAGVEVGVAAVDTTKDANAVAGMVSVDGVTMSVDAAMAAIGAIADAQAQGLNPSANSSVPGIDVAATLSANAMGELGSVVGSMTAETGSPQSVAQAEIGAAQGLAAANAAAGLVSTAANMSITDAASALSSAAKSVLSALNPVTVANATPVNVAQVSISPKSHITTDTKAFAAYTAAVAPAMAAKAAAHVALDKAFDDNDQAAMAKAKADLGDIDAQIDSLQSSFFGTPEAPNISLGNAVAGVSLGGTGTGGAGAATGGNSNAPGSTGGGKTSGISASDHDGLATGLGGGNSPAGPGTSSMGSPTGSNNSSGGGGQTTGPSGPSTGGTGTGSQGGPGPTTGTGSGAGSTGNSNTSHVSPISSNDNWSGGGDPAGDPAAQNAKGTPCSGGCNLFNIEKTSANNDLLGSDGNSDSRFHTFKTQEEAIRAFMLDMNNKIEAGNDTLSKIISSYAPASDNNNPSQHTSTIAGIVRGLNCDGCADFSGDQTLSKNDILGPLGQALAIATARAETGKNVPAATAQRGQELAKAVPSVPTVVDADGHYRAADPGTQAAVEAIIGASGPTITVQADGTVAGVGDSTGAASYPSNVADGSGTNTGAITSDSSPAAVQKFWSGRNGVNAKLYNSDGKALVDENLLKAVAMGIQGFEAKNPGYHVQIQGPNGGRRGIGALTKTFNHTPQKGTGLGAALDLRVFQKDADGKPTGKGITNHPGSAFRGELSVGQAAPIYQQIFNETVVAAYEMGGKALAQTFRFGGYFGKGSVDLMHIDVLAHLGAANGTTLSGYSSGRVSQLDIKGNTGLQSWNNVAELAKQSAEERGNGNTSGGNTTPETAPSTGPASPDTSTPSTENPDAPAAGTDPDSPADPNTSPDGQSGQGGSPGSGGQNGVNPTESTPATPSEPDNDQPDVEPTTPKSLLDDIIEVVKKIINGVIGGGTGDNQATSTPSAFERSAENQPASAALALTTAPFYGHPLLTAAYEWLTGARTVTETYADLPAILRSGQDSRPYVPVILTIDETNGTIEFDLLPVQNADMMTTPDTGQDWDDEESAGDGPSLIFDAEGNILYSDGTYAPPFENGVGSDNGFDYTYLIERYRDGELIRTEFDVRGLPGNAFTKLWKRLTGGAAAFQLNGVESITYVYIDPDTNVSGDEYKDYTIALSDGSKRQVALPAVSDFEFYRQELEGVGYTGDPFVLTILGVETARKSIERGPNAIERAVGWMTGSSNDQDPEHMPFADLDGILKNLSTSAGDEIEASDIIVINVYLKADFECPDPFGHSEAYAYEVVTADGNVYGTMCGSGLSWAYADGIARDLFDRGYTANIITANSLRDVMIFFNETIPESPAPSTKPTANLTNDVIFEVKSVANDGKTLTDWSAVESTTISAGTRLYFRWNGAAYQQCLPFLNDNGVYALKASGSAMTTGNTESEGYDVPETSAIYRIECGGQRNGEFGVDTREIKIIIK